MNNLDQKIKEFSDYILQIPEFARFQKAAANMENNNDALSVIQNVQERIQTINALQQEWLAGFQRTTRGIKLSTGPK